jgi:hypothetical protein
MVAGDHDLPAAGDVEMADAPDITGQRNVVFDFQGVLALDRAAYAAPQNTSAKP